MWQFIFSCKSDSYQYLAQLASGANSITVKVVVTTVSCFCLGATTVSSKTIVIVHFAVVFMYIDLYCNI